MTIIRRLSAATLLGATLLGATPALAQPDPIVDDLIERGTLDYKEGRFDQALNRFKAAYDRDQQADLLYNIARTYEGLKDQEQAIVYYERFLEEPDANTDARADAVKRVQLLRAIIAARQKEEPPPQPVLPPPAAEPISEVVQPAPISPTVETLTPRLERDEGGLPLSSWILFGVGAVGIGSGVAFTLLHNSNVSTVEEECVKVGDDYACPSDAQGEVDEMNRNALIADISYGVGAAALVTGFIIALASSDDDDPTASRLLITPTRDGGGYLGLYAPF